MPTAMEALGYGGRERGRSNRALEPERAASAQNETAPGLAHFFSPHYQRHNRAVLSHLESLGLPLSNSRVLELGSGPGDHTGFYVQRGCTVVAVDSRQACLNVLLERFPGVQAVQCDLNAPDSLLNLGTFDIIHCYGILYHLQQPAELISYMGRACTGMALIQTCVSADEHDHVVSEGSEDYTQSSTGRGCRPTRQWIFEELSRSFPFVYQTRTQPPNPEFPTNWNDLRDAPPLVRAVFVASKQRLDLPSLSPAIIDTQEQLRIEEREGPNIAAGRCGELISAITTVWAMFENREKDLDRAVTTIHEQAHRASVLEAAAADRLTALNEKDAALADLRSQLRRAFDRADSLEAAAAARLAALTEKDAALADLRSQLQRAFDRADSLEAAAAARLAALNEKDAALADLRSQLQRAFDRADSLEAAAAARLAALQAIDTALNKARGELRPAKSELQEQIHRFETEGLREYLYRRFRRKSQ